MTIEQANDDTLIERYVAYRDTLSKRTEKRAAEDAPYKARARRGEHPHRARHRLLLHDALHADGG